MLDIRMALHRAVIEQGASFLFLAYTDQVLTAIPFTDANGPIALDPAEVFQALEEPRPRIAFLLDLGIVAGLWEEQAAV